MVITLDRISNRHCARPKNRYLAETLAQYAARTLPWRLLPQPTMSGRSGFLDWQDCGVALQRGDSQGGDLRVMACLVDTNILVRLANSDLSTALSPRPVEPYRRQEVLNITLRS